MDTLSSMSPRITQFSMTHVRHVRFIHNEFQNLIPKEGDKQGEAHCIRLVSVYFNDKSHIASGIKIIRRHLYRTLRNRTSGLGTIDKTLRRPLPGNIPVPAPASHRSRGRIPLPQRTAAGSSEEAGGEERLDFAGRNPPSSKMKIQLGIGCQTTECAGMGKFLK